MEEMLKSTPIFLKESLLNVLDVQQPIFLLIIYYGDVNFSEFEPHMLRFKVAKLKILFTIGDNLVLYDRMNLINWSAGNFYDHLPWTLSANHLSMIVHDKVMLNDFVNDLGSIMSKIDYLDGVNIRWIFPASPMVKISFVCVFMEP